MLRMIESRLKTSSGDSRLASPYPSSSISSNSSAKIVQCSPGGIVQRFQQGAEVLRGIREVDDWAPVEVIIGGCLWHGEKAIEDFRVSSKHTLVYLVCCVLGNYDDTAIVEPVLLMALHAAGNLRSRIAQRVGNLFQGIALRSRVSRRLRMSLRDIPPNPQEHRS